MTDKQWSQRFPGTRRPAAPAEPVRPHGKGASKTNLTLWQDDRNTYSHFQQAYEKLKRAVLASLGPALSAETMDMYNGHTTKTIHDVVTYHHSRMSGLQTL